MGNIDLAAIEIVKAVAEHGGITKAATRLPRATRCSPRSWWSRSG
jgi:hypothetical protein